MSFGNKNRVSGWSYDADGNLLNDGRNNYTYDAEGRVIKLNGALTYLYDAEGRRVAKYSGSSISASYLLDLGGHQVTELNSAGTWMHSNVWAGDRLVATYEGSGESKPNTWHFHLTDWLSTQRMQTTAAGNQEEVCYSYPFGDGLTCSGTDATEHHFTSKERDVESGLDYFYARYYSSDLARFMTPDWAAAPTDVPYAQFGNPQTLNLYGYVQDSPLDKVDVNGHCLEDACVAEGIIGIAILGSAALEAGAQYYNNTPDAQQSINGAANAIGGAVSSAAAGLGNKIISVFSKKSSPPPAPAGAKSGPKAADAKCVSCNGQKANPKTGEKLGPSGNEMGHSTDHSTKKSAKEAAGRNSQDGKARNDANPTDGRGGHYHPNETDNEGSDHHYYPGKNNP